MCGDYYAAHAPRRCCQWLLETLSRSLRSRCPCVLPACPARRLRSQPTRVPGAATAEASWFPTQLYAGLRRHAVARCGSAASGQHSDEGLMELAACAMGRSWQLYVLAGRQRESAAAYHTIQVLSHTLQPPQAAAGPGCDPWCARISCLQCCVVPYRLCLSRHSYELANVHAVGRGIATSLAQTPTLAAEPTKTAQAPC